MLWHHIVSDEGVCRAALNAFDQGLPDTTDRSKRKEGRDMVGSIGGKRE
jgi:hypothetical protein